MQLLLLLPLAFLTLASRQVPKHSGKYPETHQPQSGPTNPAISVLLVTVSTTKLHYAEQGSVVGAALIDADSQANFNE